MRRLPIILAALFFAAPAWSQPVHEPPPGEREPSDEERERMMDRVRLMRMYALTEALELDEAIAAKLFPYLREGDRAVEALHEQKRTFKKQLREMARADAYDEKAVVKLVRGISELDIAIAQEHAKQLQGLSRILDAEKQVKFLLVRGRFEGEVRDMIRQERGRARSERHRRRAPE